MIRLFVALSLPAELRQRLAILGAGIPTARWTPAENLHITLRFIGEVDEAAAEDVHDQLLEVKAPAFTLGIGGIGTFDGGRRAFTLWAGVERPPALIHLRDKVDSAIVRAGLPREGRKFQPHITLARLKDPPISRLQEFVAGHNLLHEQIAVREFTLFSSHLGRNEPIYTAEATYPLEDGEIGE